jgi:hypothetical protein
VAVEEVKIEAGVKIVNPAPKAARRADVEEEARTEGRQAWLRPVRLDRAGELRLYFHDGVTDRLYTLADLELQDRASRHGNARPLPIGFDRLRPDRKLAELRRDGWAHSLTHVHKRSYLGVLVEVPPLKEQRPVMAAVADKHAGRSCRVVVRGGAASFEVGPVLAAGELAAAPGGRQWSGAVAPSRLPWLLRRLEGECDRRGIELELEDTRGAGVAGRDQYGLARGPREAMSAAAGGGRGAVLAVRRPQTAPGGRGRRALLVVIESLENPAEAGAAPAQPKIVSPLKLRTVSPAEPVSPRPPELRTTRRPGTAPDSVSGRGQSPGGGLLGSPRYRADRRVQRPASGGGLSAAAALAEIGLYPIVTFQYSSTTLYQFSYHIQ